MTAAKRVRLSSEARRAQLLELGVQMLTTRTLDELSVDALAEQAGISRGLLFHYFKNKQDFHRAVVQRAADDLLATTAPDPSLDPIPRLTRSLEHYVDYVSTNYHGYISLVRGAASGDEALREIFDRTREVLTSRITDNVEVFGLADGPAVRLLARGWSAMVEEAVLAWVPDPRISKAELLRVLTVALPAVLAASA
ncbi:MAG: TetR/AcrR family transcriptional regulator [Actinomycetota bacterium]|nr:TetR/AcrR family transcriptional regulator [Actinomycetota bacterium]MDQ2957156.1 TetR/AcrR family transcriptional regulator [Actinomycetota bacterium]